MRIGVVVMVMPVVMIMAMPMVVILIKAAGPGAEMITKRTILDIASRG
jgi:hypothetical protein